MNESARRRSLSKALLAAATVMGCAGACASAPDPVSAPAKLAIVTQPAGGTSGQALLVQPVVELQDAGGGRARGAGNAVTATIASGTGSPVGTWTQAAVDGRAAFTALGITGTGGFTLRFSAVGLGDVVSAPFSVGAAPGPRLFLTSGAAVMKFDLGTGAYLGNFASGGGLTLAFGATFGPGGDLYVAEFTNKTIQRFDGPTGVALGTFATTPTGPYQVAFGPDGNLYAGCAGGSVERFNGTTGAAMGTFVPSPGGLDMGGIAFHQGSLFVSYIGSGAGSLRQYDGTTGAPVATLYSSFSGNGPRTAVFGPDGSMYVPDWQTPNVKKFAPATYAYQGDIISAAGLHPMSLAFAPDGGLLVLSDPCCSGPDTVRRYDATTGTFLGTVVAAGAGGLGRGFQILVVP